MIMISYDDRVKYYTELTSLEAFYKESELWRILVTTMKKHNMYNEKFYGHSVLELLNEARFACLRIYSDDSPLLYFPEKYIIPTDKKLGEEAKILCCSMVLVLLYFSSPDFACRDSFIRTLHDYLQNDRNFKYFVRIIKDHQPFSFDINFGGLLHAMVEATSMMTDDSNATTETNEEVLVGDFVIQTVNALVKRMQEDKDKEIAKLKEEHEAELQKSRLNVEGLTAVIENQKSEIKKLLQKQTDLTQELKSVNAEQKAKSEIPVLPLDIFVQEANACEEKEDVVEILAVMDKLKTVLHDDHLTAIDKVIRKVKRIKTEKAKKAREEERASAKGGVTAGGANSGIMAGGNIGVNLSNKGEVEFIRRITDNRI